MRVAMQVLCVSSLSYFSQPNDWKLVTKFAELPLHTGDEKSSPEQQSASAWLLQDLCSAFRSVLGSSVTATTPLSELDALLSCVRHKARSGLNGEQLALLINHLLDSFVKRLLVECLNDFSCAGVTIFGKFDTPEQQSKLPFSVIVLGSLAKLEACPFSDLEAIVITNTPEESTTERKDPKLEESLKFVMQLLQLKLVALGESTEDDAPECPDGASRKGFSFDAKIGLAVARGTIVSQPFHTAHDGLACRSGWHSV